MKKLLTFLLLFLTATFIFNSCKKQDEILFGTVKGTVHPANLNKTVSHALVFVDADGVRYSTYSILDGTFELKAPAGQQTICMQTGDGTLFHTCVDVNIIADEELVLPASQSSLNIEGDLAYIAGAYDMIEEIVQDTLGYPITEITDADLLNPATLFSYVAVFMNCNNTVLLPDSAYINLKDFVTYGNSIYVSDFAVSYLLGDYYTASGCIRTGGFVNDTLLCTLKYGPAGLIPGTSIVDATFQSYMGTTTMDVAFDLGGWEVIQNYNPIFWDVIVSDATYGPLMLRNTSIGADFGGKIYYTTFHNEPNGLIGADMRNMLEYVILNL